MYQSLQEAVDAINPKEEKSFYEKAKHLYGLEPSTNYEFMVGVNESKESFGEVCKNPYYNDDEKELQCAN